MSESEETDESTEQENNEEETEQTQSTSIDPSELDDEMLESLMQHPQVRKYVTYNETSIPQIAAMLGNLQENEEHEETLSLLVEGISDRSGRVSESSVRKVLRGFVEEYESVES